MKTIDAKVTDISNETIWIPPEESCEECESYRFQFFHKCIHGFEEDYLPNRPKDAPAPRYRPCPPEVKCVVFKKRGTA